MSEVEFRRGAVLRRVVAGELTLKDAAVLLEVSYRQARRIFKRYGAEGSKGLVHRNVGRRSNRAIPAEYREHVLGLVRQHYSGPAERGPGQRLGPTLVAEHLFSDHGLLVPVSTLSRWMRSEDLWGMVRKTKTRHRRRPRKAHFGELVQMDGSFHDWFEGRGPRACVMTMVDDATGRTMLRFDAEETTWAAAEILRRWIGSYGVPRALYTDWKNVYLRALTSNELARGEVPVTQFGRMCEKLGIRLIGASSPQAKGRVERGHGTHQDRLIKKLRLHGISDYERANAYVEGEYEREHNARFSVAAASAVDYHTPRGAREKRRLADDAVFCMETKRVVGRDYVVQYGTRALQLEHRARGRVPVKSRVLLRETREGALSVVHVGADGGEHQLRWTEAPCRARRDRAALVALPSPALAPEQAPPAAAAVAPAPAPAPAPARGTGGHARTTRARPAADHPWNVQHRRWVEQAMQRKAVRERTGAGSPA
jgi:hypothetical protein